MENPLRLLGRNALVTGSTQGIGQAIALRLASDGANVVINGSSDPKKAAPIVDQIIAMGRKCAVIQADISKVSEVQNLVAQAVAELGSLDILVNNAGVEKHANFVDVTEADYDFVLDINLKGAFFAAQAFARHLIERSAPGKIINVSSVHEDLPFPHFAAYCASKGAMKMMMRTLSIELAPHGITVNNIAPGAIETPINRKLLNDPTLLKTLLSNIPLARLGKTTDVASVAAFLASSEADYINGSTITVDGGLTWNYSEQ